MTECMKYDINFCVESIIPTRTVRYSPSNKPWIPSDLKKLLNMKKKAFREEDRESLRTVQKQRKEGNREQRGVQKTART